MGKVDVTFEGKAKRCRELMAALAGDIKVSKNEIMKARQDIDEVFSELTRKSNLRLEVIDYIKGELFKENEDAET